MKTNIFACVTTRTGDINEHVLHATQEALRGHEGFIGRAVCSLGVTIARNIGVSALLAGEYSHIWFIDNDVLVPSDALKRLLALDVGIATGCTPMYSAKMDAPGLNVTRWPINGKHEWEQYWFSGVRESRYCGASCLLIRRDIFEQIAFPWFRFHEHWDPDKREYHWGSEDTLFCDIVYNAKLGPIMVDGNVRCQHQSMLNVGMFVTDVEADRD